MNTPVAATPPRPRFTGLRLLTDNDSAFQAKRHLIANAQATLDLCYFIVAVDASSARLMLDLIEAARRGVKVRLLVDYFMTFGQAATLRALAAVPGIEVRRYGLPRPGWLNALSEAGIDAEGFVKGMMASDVPMLAASLKGNTILPPATVGFLSALKAKPGANAAGIQAQIMAAMPTPAAMAADAPAAATAAGRTGFDRAAALRKVALVIAIVQGLKHFLHRTHHKLLLADNCEFLMGGRNLADAYQCDPPPAGRPFEDTDLMACDTRAGGSEHRLTFDTLWAHAESVDISRPDPLDTGPAAALAALQALAQPPAPWAAGQPFTRGTPLPDVDGLLFDNLPSDKGDATITNAYVRQIEALIAGGRGGTIDIVNAYLLPVDDALESAALPALRQVLIAARAAGLTVNLYTNSITSTDLAPINSAAYPKLATLIEAGVNVFELADDSRSLHTKCAALGDACLIVGSYNFDPRSELYDTNNLIVLDDPSGVATAVFRRERIDTLEWTRLTAERAWEEAAKSKPLAGVRLVQGPL